MKRIFSGIKPSGNLHIGNYLGAIKNWVKLQDEYESIFCVVDLHAITVPQNSAELQKRILEIAKIYLASGINPEKSSIFIQSHVSEHAELAWILNTIAKMSELFKMTQFKEKSGGRYILKKKLKGEVIERKVITQEEYNQYMLDKTGVGLFDYPVLMAADILLYDTQIVPVGEDQLQHIEITRALANRFNKKFGETFVIPESFITKEGMRIMGLDDPAKKMSKSAQSEYNYIALTDDAKTIRKKIKKAVTDSGSEIKYTDDKPALQNLINIYSGFSDKLPKEIEKMYIGKNYSAFKTDLTEVIISVLAPIQEKMASLSDEKVLAILKSGAEKVRPLAQKKMEEVKKKIGFII
ncbi:MAG: tryptophan--tRNA ligase [Candidatus Moranbacteria bacterium CG_4_9_14_3_um_filter_40_7]|nr:MAG: tryptophan--tRNA ligase [Candidatus Moranbacteria bacterium CG23_combo_of_CG06-09_8_20_14_all_40_16]PJA87884.1 MAG: tryptophan--tRNA ligase [Candidatus Moranbacteria bacterium CG_4_9_14_3_um_filter_40_7]